MKQYYESEVLFQLMERDGLNIPSSVPPYEAEIKAYLINQVKQAYPKLTDYEAEWLLYNYTKHLPADFPISSATDVTEATFENVVPYAYQNAILKGQTLVNLLEQFPVGCSYDSKTGIYTTTQNEWVEPVKTSQNVNVNVPYTLFAKVNTTSDNIYIRLDYNGGAIAKDPIINGSVTPNSDIFIKTTVVFSKVDRIRLVLRNTYGGIVKMSNIMLIEGDYTNQDIRFFEGMQSVKKPVLTTTGKNLFNNDDIIVDGYIISNGSLAYQTNDNRNATNFIEVMPNTTYTLSGIKNSAINGAKTHMYVGTYDKNKNFIKTFGILCSNDYEKFTTEENTQYVRFTVRNEDLNRLQLEHGTIKTSYEPYKSNILTVNEDVTLRSNGNVCDELDLLTGKLTQRIDEDGGVLNQEVVKTVELTTVNENGESVHFMPLEGTMNVQSSGEIIPPSFDMSVPVEATTQNLASFIDLQMEE